MYFSTLKMKKYLALLVLLFLFSCKEKLQKNKNIFRMNIVAGIESLDPAFAKNQYIMWHTQQIYNRLIENDSILKPIPSLAKNWTISADGKTYIFDIRTDVFFQDNDAFKNGKGRKMTAKDVVYSLNRIIDKQTASPGAWIFNGRVDNIKPFEATNDTTFIMHLQKAFNPMLQILSMQYCSIVPHEVVEKWGKDFRSHPCGTGPFALEYWEEGSLDVLKKNTNYWEKDSAGNKLPYLDGVKITFIDSKASEFLMFMQGDIHFMNTVDASFKDQILTKKGELKDEFKNEIKLQKSPYLNVEYVGILMDKNNKNANALLQNKNVRQAINMGFDKQKLVTYLRNNIGVPAQAGMIPRGLLGFDTNKQKQILYNPTKAKELLKGIDTKEPITILCPDNYVDRCTFIASQLQDIGLQIKIEVLQPTLLREQMAKSNATFFSATWIADYADAETYLTLFYGKNTAPPNYTRYNNPAFDALYEKALVKKNEKIKEKLYQQMDAIIMDDVPVIPLFYDEVVHFLHKNVKGWESNGLNMIQLKKVRLL